ncbi:hypothetical protein [Alcaligenes sp. WGS1538]|uniref:hypothetical protein n=1 Tax=Alcaligenes sp. WGS1538 TaxID=3366811 RepID=UPI00372CE943
MFEIDDTPFPARRLTATKYDDTFKRLRPGQCIKVDSEAVNRVANAMRKWLSARHRKDVVVRAVSKMDDGYGRVYMLPAKPLTMADVPSRKITHV